MDQHILYELVEIACSMGHPISHEEVSLSTRLPEDWLPEVSDADVSFRKAFLYVVEDRMHVPFTDEQIDSLEYFVDLMLFVKEHRAAVDRKLSGRA